MNGIKQIIILITLLFISSCSPGITGTVIDAETGKPIEGAVVFVEWTRTKGIGLTHTETYKIAEKLTDKEGKFEILGVHNPLVNPPTAVVYKKGYSAWRNDYIFPDYQRKNDVHLKTKSVIKLDKFKKYSHSKHISFLSMSGLSLSSSQLEQAYSWENPFARKEEELLRKKMKTLKSGERSNHIWNEIIQELYHKQVF